MSRASAIKDKISYAEYQRQKLMDEMFRAKKESVEPKFIVHTSGEILSLARECFDYCAQDIMEDIIVADTNNSYLINRYHSGKLRVYFPFYKRQLTGKKDIFQELKVVNKNLHSHLYSLAAKIEKNEIMTKTILRYADIIELNDMVNQKKHDKLICIISDEKKEFLIEDEKLKMIIPIEGQVGWNSFSVQPGSKVQCVSEFRFDYNNKEVGKFCMSATKITEKILDRIYTTFFGCSIAD